MESSNDLPGLHEKRHLILDGGNGDRLRFRECHALETLAEPASAHAARVLERLHRKAVKEGGRFPALQTETRHDLRVTLKKLRYGAEFFLPIFVRQAPARRYLARLSKLQDALGHANDSSATRSLLSVAGQGVSTSEFQRAAGALIGWVARDQLGVDGSLCKRWRAFKATPGFWRGSADPRGSTSGFTAAGWNLARSSSRLRRAPYRSPAQRSPESHKEPGL
jgi:hypothetical protein